MNNTRRKAIRELVGQVEEVKSRIEEIKGDEEEYFNNMPVALQDGEKGDKAQTVIDYLESALTATDEVVENLTDAAE